MKIDKTQQERLRRLEQEKKNHDHKLAQLEADYNNARDRLRDPIRDSVRALLADGLPKRKVYMALGFQQQNQLNNFLEPVAERMARTTEEILALARPETEAETVGYSVVNVGRGADILIHKNGKEYYLDSIDTGTGSVIYAYVLPEDWNDEVADFLAEWDGRKANTKITNNGYEHPKMKGKN